MIPRLPIIGVMGSHKQGWEGFSVPVGRLVAEMGCHLLTGAGGGVMTSVARAFTAVKRRKGVCIGIFPLVEYEGGLPSAEKYPNPYVEVPVLTLLDKKAIIDSTPYSRNHVNVMSSQAMIILPGDHGTQNEVSLALYYKKPIILFGAEGSFDKFPSAPSRAKDIADVRRFLESIIQSLQKDS